MYKFDYILLGLAAAFIIGVPSCITYIKRSPITITQATEHCVIIEQAGFKEVKCTPSINTDIPDERE
jgi:hypothetical protein